jgi:hypothetical protein
MIDAFHALAYDAPCIAIALFDFYEGAPPTMMYVHAPSLAKLKQDIAGFMSTATPPSKAK